MRPSLQSNIYYCSAVPITLTSIGPAFGGVHLGVVDPFRYFGDLIGAGQGAELLGAANGPCGFRQARCIALVAASVGAMAGNV